MECWLLLLEQFDDSGLVTKTDISTWGFSASTSSLKGFFLASEFSIVEFSKILIDSRYLWKGALTIEEFSTGGCFDILLAWSGSMYMSLKFSLIVSDIIDAWSFLLLTSLYVCFGPRSDYENDSIF